MIATYKNLIISIKKEIFYPIYLIQGYENYYIEYYANYIKKNIIKSHNISFNYDVICGKTANISDIINIAKEYPVNSKYRIIIIKNANELKNIDNINNYLLNPILSTILIICYYNGLLNSKSMIFQNCDKKGMILSFNKLNRVGLTKWIYNYCLQNNYHISTNNCNIIINYLENDLIKISLALDKILFFAKNNIVNENNIINIIGFDKKYNIFHLLDAIGDINYHNLFIITDNIYYNDRKCPINIIINNISVFFSKLLVFHELNNITYKEISQILKISHFMVYKYKKWCNNYPVGKIYKIFYILRFYDKKIKLYYNNDNYTLKELICEIFSL